jgi:hypothetical protein
MKKIILLVILMIAIGAALILLRGDEDNWICQNGQWVKHGNPSKPMPTTLCEGQKEVREIELYLPTAGDQTVGTKFVIYGKGRAFENVINYRISSDSGEQLYLGSFMTNAPDAGIFGYFDQEVDLAKLLKTIPPVIRLDVLELSAKDGSDIHKTSFRLNVDQSVTAVFAYFSNNNLDPEISCNKTFAVARLVPKTQSVLKAAIEELLNGPTPVEAKLGFGTLINPGVTINSVKISGDTATIDFSKKIEENAGGSCRIAAIRSQIANTAKQFPNIKNAVISVEGRTEDALQP